MGIFSPLRLRAPLTADGAGGRGVPPLPVRRRHVSGRCSQVGFHGVHRDVELTGHLGRAEHPGQQAEHFTPRAPAELLDDHRCRVPAAGSPARPRTGSMRPGSRGAGGRRPAGGRSGAPDGSRPPAWQTVAGVVRVRPAPAPVVEIVGLVPGRRGCSRAARRPASDPADYDPAPRRRRRVRSPAPGRRPDRRRHPASACASATVASMQAPGCARSAVPTADERSPAAA